MDKSSENEDKLVYAASHLLKNNSKGRRKRKSTLSIYQSRRAVSKHAKALRRRSYTSSSLNQVTFSPLHNTTTSEFSESETEAYGDESSKENSPNDVSNTSNSAAKDNSFQSVLPDLDETTILDEEEETRIKYVKSCMAKLLENELMYKFLRNIDKEDCLHDFMTFITLVVHGKLSAATLPFLLLMDLCRFMSVKTTTAMKYRVQTKKFWEAVYKFGGGTVIRLFSGLKNFSQVCMKKAKKSLYDPFLADINFAVPDTKILASTTCDLKEKVKCGFIQETIDRVDRTKQYNLSVDGKKVSPGCSGDEGDIYLFGLEGPPSLAEQNRRLELELSTLQEMVDNEIDNEEALVTNLDDLEKVIQLSTFRIKDQRITTVNQEILKVTFQKTMQRDPSTVKKFTQAISSIDTCQIFSANLVERVLKENKKICEIMAKMRNNEVCFERSSHVNLQTQGNCATLFPPDNIIVPQTSDLKPEYTKQGSEAWKTLRSQAAITSSTAFRALGLDTIKKQKEIFAERILGHDPPPITDELKRMFAHGRDNEIHAFGTVAGIVLPAFFPNCKVIAQVGCFFLDGENKNKLVVVSPDAVITNFTYNKECEDGMHGQHEDIGVEFKCPLGEKKIVLPVHYTLPKYYVVQILLQMKVLKVKREIYGSYNKASTVILVVTFDEDLWKDLWSLTKKLYDKVTLKKLQKVANECSSIKAQIIRFVQHNCKVLCEIPSCTATEGLYMDEKSTSPFRIGISGPKRKIHASEIKVEVVQLLKQLLLLIRQCHELERRKATELVMWVLNDTNRIFDPDSYYALPVAYVLKGYSLDVKTMRKMMNIVLQKLKDEGISVVSQSFDGQWHNIAVRGENDKPLTKFQVQKKVWNSLGRITKENLLKRIHKYTGIIHEDLQECSQSHFLTVGNRIFGNLFVSFEVNKHGNRVISAECMNGDSGISGIITKIHTPKMHERPDLWFQNDNDDYDLNLAKDKNIIELNNDANVLTLLPQEFLENDNIQSAINEITQNAIATDDQLPDIPADVATANQEDAYVVAPEDEIGHGLLHVNPTFLEQILVGLCAERRSEMWTSYTVQELYYKVLRNQKQIERLTSYELNVVNYVFFTFKGKYLFRENDLKAHKVKMLCKLFGRKRQLHVDPLLNTKKVTLRKLCMEVIKDVDYPVNIVAVALANTFHEVEINKWRNEATVPLRIKLPKSERIHESFSYPEYSPERDAIECRLMDPTHILTNIRTHICTKGYRDVKRNAFLRVSEKDNDVLNRAYIVNLVDKQCAAIAMKFFSSEVQSILYENGDEKEGDFVGLVRKWYEAVDARGIPVPVRLDNMQSFFDYLTSLVNFNVYPPKKQYVAGIPVLTFEGLLQNTSTRFQMYGLCKNNTYNQRSISTLDIETEYSLISRSEGSFNGCPKSTKVSTILKRICQMQELQSDPSKIFSLHVAQKKMYPEYNLLSEQSSLSHTMSESMDTTMNYASNVYNLKYTTHPFDRRIVRRRKRKTKNVDIGIGNKPLKRESGVRIHFKAYDSKIKSTTRHGFRI